MFFLYDLIFLNLFSKFDINHFKNKNKKQGLNKIYNKI